MARFEVAVRSPIGFRIMRRPTFKALKAPPETVAIQFDGRQFVWHAFEPRDDPDFGYEEFGPTVSVVIADDADAEAAAEALQRLLSAVAFFYDQVVESLQYGGTPGTGETDPFHPAGVRARRQFSGTMFHRAPEAIAVEPLPRARLVLALYREGLNAGSPFYGFLAFWNVLDAVTKGNECRRDAFLRAEAPRIWGRWPDSRPLASDPALYLRESARNAIAHAVRDRGRPVIDPDLPADRGRLDHDARRLRELARVAILAEWPSVVRVIPAGDPLSDQAGDPIGADLGGSGCISRRGTGPRFLFGGDMSLFRLGRWRRLTLGRRLHRSGPEEVPAVGGALPLARQGA